MLHQRGNPVDDATCISASGFQLRGVGREAETDSTRLRRCHAFSKNVRSGGNAGERPKPVYPPLERITRLSGQNLLRQKSREETLDARLLEAEDEKALLRGEVRQLRTEVSIKKKQREDLQLRLSAQKEELEVEFAAEREKLEADYQKQVEDMYFLRLSLLYEKNMASSGTSLQYPQAMKKSCAASLLNESFSFWPYFAIVMSGCPLLIVCHPDGCSFLTSSAQSKFLPNSAFASSYFPASVRIVGNPIRTPGSSSTHFPLACSSLFFKAVIKSCLWLLLAHYFEDNAVWSMNSGYDVFPYELGDIFVFDASVCFSFHPFTEVIRGDEQEFLCGCGW
ncbi:hypothetical protein CK203_063638 [Vitis vinifera]|uniref:Uncharacterized protein n=1 Tax=Vitis vinifera TaxID=29760 RepID=A0A438G4V2_VITVI|nr:hypothetical protein CK203_063638 [Vitis vinifera]